MPGDTSRNGQVPDSQALLADSGKADYHTERNSGNASPDAQGVQLWEPLFVFGLLVGVWLISRVFRYQNLKRREKGQKKAKEAVQSHFSEYDGQIAELNSYYRGLPLPLKARFLERVIVFMDAKKFVYVDLEPEPRMPLLISAAAVQLTFGLDKYLLDYFETIHIIQHDYRFGLYNVPFMGHVDNDGIYLSWDNFLKGFKDDSDADNVGIHEMAHALAFANFLAQDSESEDPDFKMRFREFSKVARPLFNDMQTGVTTLLDGYAATNYNEFWAVAVENFFEKAEQMKLKMPELYKAMCILLNQDPLLPGKILGSTP
jgi:MtfA peptidase